MLNSPTFSALSAISDQAPKWAIAAIVNFKFKQALSSKSRPSEIIPIKYFIAPSYI